MLIPPFVWRQALNRATFVVVQSQVINSIALRFGIKNCKIIPNGVNFDRFKLSSQHDRVALRRKLDLPSNYVIVITTGRYEVDKNQITLIKAVDNLQKIIPLEKFSVLILVASEEKSIVSNEYELKSYVAEKNLGEYIHFMEDVKNVEDYLKASDIFVLPTNCVEGMPNALLEAMACGLPVISSNLPQVTCIFPENKGHFFYPTDIQALIKHLITLIDSPKIRENYGALLSAHIQKFHSFDKVTDKYLNMIQNVIGERES